MSRSWVWLFLFASSFSFAQVEELQYKRELNEISGNWHKVILPDDLFGKLADNMYDLRIFGITEGKDTLEAPYLLQLSRDKVSETEVKFRTINTSSSNGRYYYTFENSLESSVNQIELDFRKNNFDYRITVEGSQDQREWFTVTENYRILSIRNAVSDFEFTTLNLPESLYRYFRISLESKEDPQLLDAKILYKTVAKGSLKNYSVISSGVKENKDFKTTEITLKLAHSVPVSSIKIKVKDTFDYYRPVTIKYLVDSLKTERGWIYNYRDLATGTLNSLEENVFHFKSTILKNLKIEVSNADNLPLNFGDITVQGYEHALIARFTEPAEYYLAYGGKNIQSPQYDIDKFTEKIPSELSIVPLGPEQLVENNAIQGQTPLFQNKLWLWVALLAIILVLGWYSLKMIKDKENN